MSPCLRCFYEASASVYLSDSAARTGLTETWYRDVFIFLVPTWYRSTGSFDNTSFHCVVTCFRCVRTCFHCVATCFRCGRIVSVVLRLFSVVLRLISVVLRV